MRHLAALGLLISLVCACVGPVPDPDVRAVPDAGGDPTPDAGELACVEEAPVLPDGNHNAGMACLSCHTGQAVAPRWTLAGTLYDSRQGTAPIAGATVTVIDATGAEHALVTASNGNFYTSAAITFPVTVSASKCPDTREMTSLVGSGDCNGCHTANASQGRIHLP